MAYTIVESLVVLTILSILTMVLFALLKHEKDASPQKDKASPTPRSAPADPSPSPSIEDKEK